LVLKTATGSVHRALAVGEVVGEGVGETGGVVGEGEGFIAWIDGVGVAAGAFA
jgi:hypothetical protein